jgi:hypothetical protein
VLCIGDFKKSLIHTLEQSGSCQYYWPSFS